MRIAAISCGRLRIEGRRLAVRRRSGFRIQRSAFRNRLSYPFASFGPVAAMKPEPENRSGQAQCDFRLLHLDSITQRRAQIAALVRQSPQPLSAFRSVDPRFDLFGQAEEKPEVTPPRGCSFCGIEQALLSILPHRFQQPITRYAVPLMLGDVDERFVNKTG